MLTEIDPRVTQHVNPTRYRRNRQPGATYFFTLVTFERWPILAGTPHVERFRAAVQKVQQKRPFNVEAEVILPDHVHVLWTLPDGDADYIVRVRLLKSFFTKSLSCLGETGDRSASRAMKGEQAIWQRRYCERTIRDEQDFQSHVDYIHFNPVKHRLAKSAGAWPHSTFRDWVQRGGYEPWWGSDDMPPRPDWVGWE
jgi:putative transposase